MPFLVLARPSAVDVAGTLDEEYTGRVSYSGAAMTRGRVIIARCVALVLLAAVSVSVLHYHAALDGEKTAACPAAAWHGGAVIHAAGPAAIAVAPLVLSAPVSHVAVPACEHALRPSSPRAPPCDA